MKAKKVLLITYYFPPRQGVASLRLGGLAKYLPEFGWIPTILTTVLPSAPDPRFRVVQTLYPGDVSRIMKKKLGLQPEKGFQEQVGVPTVIRESKRSFTSRMLTLIRGLYAYPDEQKLWYPFAVEAGSRLLNEEKFDVILSSSYPVTAHLIAHELKQRYQLPWIADFRDLWTQNHYYPYGAIRRFIERKLELRTLSTADALVTVSSPLAKQLAILHKEKPVFAIPNGFDPDEVRSSHLTKKFTITYTGQLYEGKRDPLPLFHAIHELISEGVLNPQKIEVNFFCPTQYWLEKEVTHYGLGRVVHIHGIVPRMTVLDHQRASQILLLLNWNNPREEGVYTGKLFEYLAAQRPILAVGGPGGVVKELLERTKAGVHVSTVKEVKEVLAAWYQEYEATGQVSYHGIPEEVKKYNHLEMARKFAEVMDMFVRP